MDNEPHCETVNKQPVLSFQYQSHTFTVELKTPSDKPVQGQTDCTFSILEGNKEHGFLRGTLRTVLDNQIEYHPISAVNNFIGKPTHVPHLISTTIAQLITNGVVDIWISQNYRTGGGEKMYTRLKQNPDLDVQEIHSNPSSLPLYRVTKKL
jgi:hypothetical protein